MLFSTIEPDFSFQISPLRYEIYSGRLNVRCADTPCCIARRSYNTWDDFRYGKHALAFTVARQRL